MSSYPILVPSCTRSLVSSCTRSLLPSFPPALVPKLQFGNEKFAAGVHKLVLGNEEFAAGVPKLVLGNEESMGTRWLKKDPHDLGDDSLPLGAAGNFLRHSAACSFLAQLS